MKTVCLLWIATSYLSAQDSHDLVSMFQPPTFQVGDVWKSSYQEETTFKVPNPKEGGPKTRKLGGRSVYSQKVTAVDENGAINEAVRFYRTSEAIIPKIGSMANSYSEKFVVYRREGDAWNITAYVVEDGVRHEIELEEMDLDELAEDLPDEAVGNYADAMKLLPTLPVKTGDSWKTEILAITSAIELGLPANYELDMEKSHLTATLVEVTDSHVRLSFQGAMVMSGQDDKGLMQMDSHIALNPVLVSYRRGNFFNVAMKAVTEVSVKGNATDEKVNMNVDGSYASVQIKKVVFPSK